jgi:hypothetical protein
MGNKSTLSIAGRQTESSSELATGIGEFFKNRLELSAFIIIGLPKNTESLAFAVDGDEDDLGALLRAIIKMAPPGVRKAVMKQEIEEQYKAAGKLINSF